MIRTVTMIIFFSTLLFATGCGAILAGGRGLIQNEPIHAAALNAT